MYDATRTLNPVSSRFQSNHQRGYFRRHAIISATGRNRMPPAPSTVWPLVPPTVGPVTSPRIRAMGMTVNGRKKVVSRSSSRSGYSIWSVAGKSAGEVAMAGAPVVMAR